MAVVDTNKSANDYATALKHLLPPGEYFNGEDVDKITLSQAEELARIHAKVNIDFNINTNQNTLGWTLDDYRALLLNEGMSDFKVFDKCRLPLVSKSKSGSRLGSIKNVSMICIIYPKSQVLKIQAFALKLIVHKLSHTRIVAMHANLRICGSSRCGEQNSILLV